MSINQRLLLESPILQRVGILLALIMLVRGWLPASAVAQSITPTRDRTNTRVQRRGDRFEIDGGQRSRDGSNLFHSFEQFGLSQNQVADFLSDANVRNILGRVTGGDASYIDGLLRVSGSNANLFLLNPMGIIFGAHARLDLPASFIATTATGIGFNNGWFSAVGSSDYAALVGNPQQFAFAIASPGTILNTGDLTVNPAQTITLLGGTVVNTGTLTAPGGTITIAAIPGENRVRLSQPGHLLSLELDSIATGNTDLPNPISLTPQTLPALLTGGSIPTVSQIVVNSDGTIQLTSTAAEIPLQPGTAIAAGIINASTLDASSSLSSNAEVNILGDRVALLNANVDASGTNGGGTLRIGGDYQGQGSVFNATQTYVSADSVLNAAALTQGNGGRIIIWADDTTQFWGSAIARGGNIAGNGGFVEISGRNQLGFLGTVQLEAPFGQAGTVLFDPTDINIVAGVGTNDAQLTATGNNILFASGGIANFQIGAAALEAIAGNITLQATQDINLLAPINLPGTSGSDITFTAGRNFNGGNQAITAPSRNIFINAGGVTTDGSISVGLINTRGGVPAPGGSVTLNASNDITTGSVTTFADSDRDSTPTSNPSGGGSISINSQRGSIDTTQGSLAAGADEGRAGDIILRARGNIRTAFIGNGTIANVNDAGNISLVSETGSIDTTGSSAEAVNNNPNELISGIESGFVARNGGTIEIRAFSDITTGDIRGGGSVNGATISLISQSGRIDTSQGSLDVTDPNPGVNDPLNGRPVTLTAPISINLGSIRSSGRETGGDIKVTSPTIQLGGELNTSGANLGGSIFLNGLVNLRDDANFNTSSSGTSGGVSFTNRASGDRTLSINAGNDGIISFQNDVDIGSLDIVSAGNTIVDGDITTNNQSLLINSPVSITNDSALFDAGRGDITIGAAMTASNSLSLLGNNITLSDFTSNQLSTTANTISLTGLVNSNQVNITADNLEIGNTLIVNDGLLLQTESAGRDISLGTEVAGTLSLSQAEISNLLGPGLLTIGQAETTGNISVLDDLTFNTAVSLLPGSSSILLNGDITTVGQNLTLGNTILTNNATLSTGTGRGTITLNGTVNSNQTPNYSLSLNAGNRVQVNRTIGEPGQYLNGLSFEAARILLGGDLNVTSGNLVFNNPVTLTDNVALRTSQGNIRFANTLNSTNGANDLALSAANGDVFLQGRIGNSSALGDITVSRAQRFQTASTINSGSLQYRNGTGNVILGGDVTTRTAAGVAIQTSGNINTQNITTNGGAIALQSNRIQDTAVTTGNLDTSVLNANGGNVTIEAGDRITAGTINTSSINGNGGDVSLDPRNDIQVTSINTQSQNARGGNIAATTERFFLANGTFAALNGETASLSAMGGTAGGNITISHFGGARLTAFDVGNLVSNGTAAAILSGAVNDPNAIAPLRSFPGPYRQNASLGNIVLVTQPAPYLPETERQLPLDASRDPPKLTIDILLDTLETYFTRQVTAYLGLTPPPIKSVATIQSELNDIEQATGVKPAVIYAVFLPRSAYQSPEVPLRYISVDQDDDELNLILVMPRQAGDDQIQAGISPAPLPGVVWMKVPGVTRRMAVERGSHFRTEIINDFQAQTNGYQPNLSYLDDAQALYSWLIQPLDAELRDRGIQNLTFVLDSGLRRIPLAALHDGQNFIIERYSIGLMPSLSLTDARYKSLRDNAVLTAGASVFERPGLNNLPAVPDELLSIGRAGWRTRSLLNEAFTADRLIQNRQTPFGIIHIATHADFNQGTIDQSYIQLWGGDRITLDRVRTLGWNDPPVRLLVLSACNTAEGDETVELGFAGMAVQSQVESVLAGIWRIKDAETLPLMAEFYQQLNRNESIIKAEALRQAQLKLLHQEGSVEARQVQNPDTATGLPEFRLTEQRLLAHPRIWSGFTIVGSPW